MNIIHEQGPVIALIILAILLMAYLNLKAQWEKRRIQGLTLSWVTLFSVLGIGGLCCYTASESTKNSLEEKLSSLAQTFASTVQRMGHADVSFETPRDDDLYAKILEQLTDWQARNPFVASIYTMRRDRKGTLRFVFDPESDLNRNGSIDTEFEWETPNGTIYVPPPNANGIVEFTNSFNGHADFSWGVVSDNYGAWVTATVPLWNKAGNVEAVLGVDFWGEDWQLEIRHAQFWPLAFFVLSLLLFFSVQFYLSEVRKTEETLKENADVLNSLVSELSVAKQKADNASQAKSQFLANMSHEIRTPMTAILGYNEFLDDPKTSDQQRQEAVRVVRNNANLLMQILNDILDFSKMEAGKMSIEIREISLVPLLDEIAVLFASQVEEKQIELSMTNTTAFPEIIRTDSIRMKQILMNIIGNAVKFTSKGGIYLSLSWIPDENSRKRNYLVIEIRDTGIGMSPEKLEQLFEPFHQADNSTTRHYGGTGLGLTIVNRLVRLLDGRIEVEAALDVGSTFRLFFPQPSHLPGRLLQSIDEGRESEETKTKDAKQSSRKRGIFQGRRILLAEDAKDLQRLLSLILINAGAEVTLADNGLQAYEKAMKESQADRPFDIIVMDMQMPVMDGYTAVQKLRDDGYIRPIVALTAAVLQNEIDLCFLVGCNDWAAKPIKKEVLLELLQRNFGDSF